MSSSKEEILIDYLDNNLSPEDREKVVTLLQTDEDAQQSLDALQWSVAAIREQAIVDQVQQVRASLASSAKIVALPANRSTGIVRSFTRNSMKVAAILFLLVTAGGIIKYSTTSNTSVYMDNFSSFDIATARGNSSDDAVELAYRKKDWKAVEDIAAAANEKTAKNAFLAGMAALELKDYNQAIASFSAVLQKNSRATEAYYQDEAEYYLAMSYLAANRGAAALPILQKIRADKDHIFYKKARAISALDLQVLSLKN
ncbi:MAG TPA: hypothetical protein VL307_02125 [Chitinophagaceae bacterium]|nr:hypothetical protein [Chitinophagaceae bacterium]